MKKLQTVAILLACGAFLAACSTQPKSDNKKTDESSMMDKKDKMSDDKMKDDKMKDGEKTDTTSSASKKEKK